MIAAALSEGFHHINTAQAYENEEQVDEGPRRNEVFLTPKILPKRFTPESFTAAADASLKRLEIDCLERLLLHWPAINVPIKYPLAR
ncbi:aldo/keto reductase [Loktanella salsilacus]|uniref:aldo/keto reductase n=1 Tax=Loktanella salsilacus TaxID=195913 RepID=UPI0037353066